MVCVYVVNDGSTEANRNVIIRQHNRKEGVIVLALVLETDEVSASHHHIAKRAGS